jgi:hypothetical protein
MNSKKAKRRIQKLEEFLTVCSNCGQRGRHFVPPSSGEEGFFACKSQGLPDDDRELNGRDEP